MNNIDAFLDQLTNKETASIKHIPTSMLHPFPGHPFKVQDDEDMEQLTQSIQMQGVLTPLVIRPFENGEYEVISGHRRLHACRKAGIETVPALVYAIDRDAAAIALVDSNLHRERILPSEKAFAYKLKMDALSKQGKRTDLTSDQVGPKLTAATLSSDDSLIPISGANPVSLRSLLTRNIAATLSTSKPTPSLSRIKKCPHQLENFGGFTGFPANALGPGSDREKYIFAALVVPKS